MTSYILNKFSEYNNIDKEYGNIYDKLYIRNFIGFNNVIEMNKFIHFDFRSQIKRIFPNNIFFIIFGLFSLAVIIALMFFSFIRIRYIDTPKKNFEGNPCCV